VAPPLPSELARRKRERGLGGERSYAKGSKRK
jgi:hypothetical protein